MDVLRLTRFGKPYRILRFLSSFGMTKETLKQVQSDRKDFRLFDFTNFGCVRDGAFVGALLWSVAEQKATRESPTDYFVGLCKE